jgi:hypothetical protein
MRGIQSLVILRLRNSIILASLARSVCSPAEMGTSITRSFLPSASHIPPFPFSMTLPLTSSDSCLMVDICFLIVCFLFCLTILTAASYSQIYQPSFYEHDDYDFCRSLLAIRCHAGILSQHYHPNFLSPPRIS